MKTDLQYWAAGSPAASLIRHFIESASDPASSAFVPPEDRIAVFDLDGTLGGRHYPTYFDWCMFVQRVLYDPDCRVSEEVRGYALKMEEGMRQRKMPEDTEIMHAHYAPPAYKGMSVREYKEYVRAFKLTAAEGFEGLTRGEAFFLPMVSVFSCLQANGFSVYISSGTDENCVSVQIEGVLNIPDDHIIGTVNRTVPRPGVPAEAPLSEDDRILAGELIFKNIGHTKVLAFEERIGKRPVLFFGDSLSDFYMAEYTAGNRKYPTAVFLLLADDDEREFAEFENVSRLKTACAAAGFYTVSMKNDMSQIYGENVRKALI